MGICSVVDLFRAAGRPIITAGAFSASMAFTPDTIKLISNAREASINVFDELLIDEREVFDNDPLPITGNKIDFVIRPPQDSANSFHASLKEFLKSSPQISRGEIPTDFYLINEDYFSGDDICSPKISVLSAICDLIKKLSQLANYHDSKATSDHYKLVFVQPGELRQISPVVLETQIIEKMLENEIPDLEILDELCTDSAKSDAHYNEKIGIFWTSLTEFVEKKCQHKNSFFNLVKYWKEFIVSYRNNLGTYLSGFSFHKAKREIAEAEFGIAEQLSKITSDIAGSLFSIPISIAGTIVIFKTENTTEICFILFGLLLIIPIIFGIIFNKKNQLKRIEHAKGIIFDSIEGKKQSYPENLKNAIDSMIVNINSSIVQLKRWLNVYLAISFAPFVLGLIIFVDKIK